MMKFLTGSLSFVFQVILVVAAVLVFSYFDPFGILSPQKLKLKNTPISVKSMKEIGQLISAEYYGEVIASLPEALENEKVDALENVKEELTTLHNDFFLAIRELTEWEFERKREKRRKNLFELFVGENSDLVTHPLWDYYAYLMYRKVANPNFRYEKKHLNNIASQKDQERLVKRLFDDLEDNAALYNVLANGNVLGDLIGVVDKEFETVKKKKVKKSRLVLVGRGWVKAGFDFGKFTENNFNYDTERRIVHLIGMEPTILSATINPWFIPEEKIEGFEFLVAKGKVKRSATDVNKVKRLCLAKLKKQADEREILQIAERNARENLKNFFSLLIDDPEGEVHDVIIHSDPYAYTLSLILGDELETATINDAEFQIIDRLVDRTLRDAENDPMPALEEFNASLEDSKTLEKVHKAQEMLQTLKDYYGYFTLSVDVNAPGTSGNGYFEVPDLNRFTGMTFSIVQDGKLDLAEQNFLLAEWERLKKVRAAEPIDLLWNFSERIKKSKKYDFKTDPSLDQIPAENLKRFGQALKQVQKLTQEFEILAGEGADRKVKVLPEESPAVEAEDANSGGNPNMEAYQKAKTDFFIQFKKD